ncbi:sigma-70 family RNA polymerase sigma factor [Lutibacter sp.]|uniref:sigma-70 family RNA polymerase sigma factor n=1 Tax=Lutibacter sp. TaxID=1925666 RepID=UPI001A346735|nr:sigma-70 family RNA polymerase sigma factor [Lutibacter sp.]MBI9040245.1 sigma-70 family RNA polymerase sigma factor [Lutibacter sp.]
MTKINKYSEVSSLWLDYKNGLKFYILKKVKDEETANDLSHEVLMKIYNSCCSGSEIMNVRSWMFQIAHNTTIDYLKKENKFIHEVPEMFEKDENNSYKEVEDLLKPLIELLPEKYAIPLQLSDIEELKQAEVSTKLNLSLTATKSRIQRARKLLKEKIIECSILELDEKGNLLSLEIKQSCEPLQKHLSKKK